MADFKLGRLKFKWRGDWATSTGYVIDDIVKYGGNSYVCIQNHTSPNNENIFYTSPGTYTNYWELHGESFFFKGTYANSTWYKLNDVVSYGGKQYRTTTAHTSSSAVLDQSKFEQYSDGITFRGDYTSTTQYRLNDLVKYGGRTYRVTTEHTSAAGGDVNIDLAKFTLYSEGLAFRGDWATTTYYRLDDVVKFGSYQYRCTTAHTSGATSDDFAQANFSIYSEGLQFEDSYNASTVYSKGDVVTYGGYSYVYVAAEEASGQTPADNATWDVITTGFNATGVYSHGTAYKTGDTVQYGGNNYVCILDATNQRPANTNGTDNSTYWKKIVGGFNFRGTYDATSTYNVGDVVRYSSNSYVALKDQQINIQPGSDATVWSIVAQGDTAAVLTTRGDMITQNDGGVARLPIGLPGSNLTTDGNDIVWSGTSAGNVLWVSPSGNDNLPGTESQPYKTIKHALERAKAKKLREVENVSGGTGGTAGTYNDVRGVTYKQFTVSGVPTSTSFEISLATSTYAHTYVSGGEVRKTDDTSLTVTNAPYNNSSGVITITTSGAHGLSVSDTVRVRGLDYTCSLGAKTYPELGESPYFRVNTSGSVSVEIVNGTADHNVGDKIRVDGSEIGGATAALTMDVKSVASDTLRVKNGTFSESLPLLVRSGVSVVGESLRNTKVQPASGNGTQIKTVKLINGPSAATNGTYQYIHPSKIQKKVTVASAPDATSITVNLGTSTLAHTYVRGGLITNAAYGEIVVSNAVYNNSTGVCTITTTTSHGLSASDEIKLSGLQYTTTEGDKFLPEVGTSAVFIVNIIGGESKEIITYHGGAKFNVGDIITLPSNKIGGGGDLTLEVGSLEANSASNMWLCNDSNNIRNFTFVGLTGTKKAGGLYKVSVTSGTSFTVPTLTDTLTHSYVKGGNVIAEGAESTDISVSNYAYAHGAGEITVNTNSSHGLTTNDYVTLGRGRFNITDVGERVLPKGVEMGKKADGLTEFW